jgi:hypothetical protein
MNLKTKRRIVYLSISVLTIYCLFSLLEIFNLASLYKDQVEMSAMTSHESVSSDFIWDLLQKAKELTNWINFFQYSALTSIFIVIMLIRWTIKSE